MRAVVFEGKEKVSVQNVPDPELPSPAAAILEVEQTAICGSDLHYYWAELGDPVGIRPGHEFTGRVVEVGSDVSTFDVGDRVLASGVLGCGACAGCTEGRPTACVGGLNVFGVSLELPGGQAERVAVPNADANLRKIPDSITAEQAVLLTDALPTGYCGARAAQIRPGQSIAVVGLGPVGTCAILAAQKFGPARIFAIDFNQERLRKAEGLGAIPIDASQGASVEQVMAATEGRGVDAVIEAVGSDASMNDAIAMAAIGGHVSIIGVNFNFAFPLAVPLIGSRNLHLHFVTADVHGTWPVLFPLLETGALRTDELFSHRLPLAEAAQAYNLFANREEGCFKVLLETGS